MGATADTGDSNYMNGSRVQTGPLGGQLRSISVYFRGPIDIVGFRRYSVALYGDVNGRPAQRLATSANGTITADRWNTLQVIATLTPNTWYWLMTNNNGQANGVQVLMFDTQPSDGAFSVNSQPFGTWPATFGPSTLNDMSFSIYMTLAKP